MPSQDLNRMRRLLEAVVAVGSDLSLPDVLQRIVESARSLVDARYAALGVLDEEGRALSQFITVGIPPGIRRQIGPLPAGHGILGLLIVDARPLRLPDLTAHPDSFGFPPHHPTMHSFLGVPVLVRERVFGNLYLTEKQGAEEFSQEDEDLVMALATGAGVAIENARLHARVRELALLEDRGRIARDLHDTVIQRLFATGLGLQSAVSRAVNPEVTRRVQEAVDDLDETIRQIRTTIFALETQDEARPGVRAAILQVAQDESAVLGFEPTIAFSGPLDALVGARVEEHLLSTLREALSNIGRHAEATAVRVDVRADDDIVLRVTDNGAGLPGGGAPASGGHGLGNMRSRAEDLGGTMELRPGPDGGTCLEWRVPARRS